MATPLPETLIPARQFAMRLARSCAPSPAPTATLQSVTTLERTVVSAASIAMAKPLMAPLIAHWTICAFAAPGPITIPPSCALAMLRPCSRAWLAVTSMLTALPLRTARLRTWTPREAIVIPFPLP
jgi:hypothetical protein